MSIISRGLGGNLILQGYGVFEGTVPYTARYPDIITWAQSRVATLTAAAIDREAGVIIAYLLTQYPCLVSYETLSGNDKLFFDKAVGLMVAALLRGLTGPTSADIIKRKEGDTEYTFKNFDTQKPLHETWEEMAWVELSHIACIAAGLAPLRAFNPFSLSGRRRAAESAGYRYDAGNPLAVFLDDERRRIYGY